MILDPLLVSPYFKLSGLTDSAISKKSGVSTQTLWHMKTGRNVKVEKIQPVADAIGIPVEVLTAEQGRGFFMTEREYTLWQLIQKANKLGLHACIDDMIDFMQLKIEKQEDKKEQPKPVKD